MYMCITPQGLQVYMYCIYITVAEQCHVMFNIIICMYIRT